MYAEECNNTSLYEIMGVRRSIDELKLLRLLSSWKEQGSFTASIDRVTKIYEHLVQVTYSSSSSSSSSSSKLSSASLSLSAPSFTSHSTLPFPTSSPSLAASAPTSPLLSYIEQGREGGCGVVLPMVRDREHELSTSTLIEWEFPVNKEREEDVDRLCWTDPLILSVSHSFSPFISSSHTLLSLQSILPSPLSSHLQKVFKVQSVPRVNAYLRILTDVVNNCGAQCSFEEKKNVAFQILGRWAERVLSIDDETEREERVKRDKSQFQSAFIFPAAHENFVSLSDSILSPSGSKYEQDILSPSQQAKLVEHMKVKIPPTFLLLLPSGEKFEEDREMLSKFYRILGIPSFDEGTTAQMTHESISQAPVCSLFFVLNFFFLTFFLFLLCVFARDRMPPPPLPLLSILFILFSLSQNLLFSHTSSLRLTACRPFIHTQIAKFVAESIPIFQRFLWAHNKELYLKISSQPLVLDLMQSLKVFASEEVVTQIQKTVKKNMISPIVRVSLPVHFFEEEKMIVANQNPSPKEKEVKLANAIVDLVASIYQHKLEIPLNMCDEEREAIVKSLSLFFVRVDMELERIADVAKKQEFEFPPLPYSERIWRFADTSVDKLHEVKRAALSLTNESEEVRERRRKEVLEEVNSMVLAPVMIEEEKVYVGQKPQGPQSWPPQASSRSRKKKKGNVPPPSTSSVPPPATSSSSKMPPAPRHRRSCAYGVRCTHLALSEHTGRFSHPGDADYILFSNHIKIATGKGNGEAKKNAKDKSNGENTSSSPLPSPLPKQTGPHANLPLSIMKRLEIQSNIHHLDLSCMDRSELKELVVATNREEEEGETGNTNGSGLSNESILNRKLVIGHAGEFLTFQYLYRTFSSEIETGEVEVKWVNEFVESGHPYDVIVTRNKEPILYVEVKSTTTSSHVIKPVEISWKEIQFALEKGETYHVYRVSLSREHGPHIAVFPHLSSRFASHELQLFFQQIK